MITTHMRQIGLPSALCDEAERRFGAQFATIEDLLAFVLEQLLHDPAADMDESEQQEIEKRLRDLGYL
jgi:hypothetical protein